MAAAGAADVFLALWSSGACDELAQIQLLQLLQHCPLSGRVLHGDPRNPGFGRLLSTDEWVRLSWVFGPEALPGFLGKSPRDILLQLGFAASWLDAKLARGTQFKLAIFPSESVDARLATWDGVQVLLKRFYPEVWRSKIAEQFPHIRSTPFATLEARAGYIMAEVNLVGRHDPVTGESADPRYVSLQRLLRREGTLTEVRQFLFDEVGLAALFSGSGRTMDAAGKLGPFEYLCRNLPLDQISGAAVLDVVPSRPASLEGGEKRAGEKRAGRFCLALVVAAVSCGLVLASRWQGSTRWQLAGVAATRRRIAP